MGCCLIEQKWILTDTIQGGEDGKTIYESFFNLEFVLTHKVPRYLKAAKAAEGEEKYEYGITDGE